MIRNRNSCLLVCAIFVVLFATQSGFSQKLKLPFRAKAKKTTGQLGYLQANHGPWLVMCASFSGDTAEQDARRLATDLQRRRLNCYLYRQNFDFSGTFLGKGWATHTGPDQKLQPKKMKVANHSEVNEVAVLVGDFTSIDSPDAQKTLKMIKTLSAGDLKNTGDIEKSQSFKQWKDQFKRTAGNETKKPKGPLGAAFLIANPLLPEDYLKQKGMDEFVLKMNRNLKHSLFDCPEKYSVRVATFRGFFTVNAKEMEEHEKKHNWLKKSGKADPDSKSLKAMEDALLLTQELRRRGVEAYQFHDRVESYVCVGSFDHIKQNGKLNEEIIKVILAFKAEERDVSGYSNAMKPKSLNSKKLRKRKIYFDAQPVPVLVPRKSVKTAMNTR